MAKKNKKLHKRGRPKGSKNKATLLREAQERSTRTESPPPAPPPKSFKHLGYCKCGALVGEIDLLSKFIYKCPHCTLKGRVNSLSKSSKGETFSSKKDYLEHTLNADFHDMPPLNEDLDPNDVKVKE
jgi:hypothetical protein